MGVDNLQGHYQTPQLPVTPITKEGEERGPPESPGAPRGMEEETQPNQLVSKEDSKERKLATNEAMGEWETSMRRPHSRRNRKRLSTMNSAMEAGDRGAGLGAEVKGSMARDVDEEPTVEREILAKGTMAKEKSAGKEKKRPKWKPEPAQRVNEDLEAVRRNKDHHRRNTSSRWAWMWVILGIISMGASINGGGKTTRWMETKVRPVSLNKVWASSVRKLQEIDPELRLGQSWDP